MKTVRKIEKYGTEVFQNIEMDEQRRAECLCLNCDRMIDCTHAEELFDICKSYNIALMVTRCPYWCKRGE